MKKRTKLSLVLSSLAAIMVAGATMAGGTYALFTSESKVDISVKSGKVAVIATVSDLKTYSGVDLIGDPKKDVISETATNGTFTNGGTASISDNTLTLDKMTPGDKVTFNIKVENSSNVDVQYRTVLKAVKDDGLFDCLKVKIGEEEYDGGVGVRSKYDTWSASASDQAKTIAVEISMPSDVGNEYQDLSCTLSYMVEAIQGNAQTDLHVDSSNIQEYLDGKHGSINGKTFYLASGNYDTIYLRQSKEGSTKRDDLKKQSYEAYYRSFKDIVIKAEEGATVNLKQFEVEAGLFSYNTAQSSNSETDFKNVWFISYVELENVMIDGLHFNNTDTDKNVPAVYLRDNESIDQIYGSAFVVDGFTVQNCEGVGNGNNDDNNYFFSAGSGSNDSSFMNVEGNKKGLNNIVLRNNTISKYYQPIHFNNSVALLNNFTVKGNTFTECYNNNAQISNKSNTGTFKFINNTLEKQKGRFVRMAGLDSSSKVIVSGNKIKEAISYDDDGSIFKVTGTAGFKVIEGSNEWSAGSFSDNTTWIANGDASRKQADTSGN